MHINWENIQKRYVDPYSTEELKIDGVQFTKPLLTISEDEKGVVKGLKIIGLNSPTSLIISKGVVCISKIFIEFLEDMIIDIKDTYFYKTPRFGVIQHAGNFPIVIDYIYSRSITEPPIAKLKILKYPFEEYEHHMVPLGNFTTDVNGVIVDYNDDSSISTTFNRLNFLFAEELMTHVFEEIEIPRIDGGVI